MTAANLPPTKDQHQIWTVFSCIYTAVNVECDRLEQKNQEKKAKEIRSAVDRLFSALFQKYDLEKAGYPKQSQSPEIPLEKIKVLDLSTSDSMLQAKLGQDSDSFSLLEALSISTTNPLNRFCGTAYKSGIGETNSLKAVKKALEALKR